MWKSLGHELSSSLVVLEDHNDSILSPGLKSRCESRLCKSQSLPLVAMPPGIVQGMGTPPKTKSKRFFILE